MKFKFIVLCFTIPALAICQSQGPHNVTPHSIGSFAAKDSLLLNAQWQKFFVPSFPRADLSQPFVAPDKTYKTIITNNSSKPISIAPYLNRAGMEQIVLADSFLISYLLSQISGLTDTDDVRLKLIQVLATKIEKTDLFTSANGVIYNPNTDVGLYLKQNSLIGALNTYHKQCGNYVQSSIAILVKTGFFDYNNIQIVQLIGHITCQFLYRGNWVFADFDPEEPFFMIRDSANANGFASPLDIYNDRGLITDEQKYYYVTEAGDSMDLSPAINITTQRYRNKFDSVSFYPVPFTNDPLNISGIIRLPAKASLIAECHMPYVLDSNSLSVFLAALATNNADTVYYTLSQILGVSLDSAATILGQQEITINYTTKNWIGTPWYEIAPSITIVLQPTSDIVKIKSDAAGGISFPGYIMSSNATIYFPDTVFEAGESPILWLPTKSVAPVVSNGEVQYLANGGFISPHSNADTITVSYNPMILDFGEGFQLGYLPGDSILAEVYVNDTLVASDSTYHPGSKPNLTSLAAHRISSLFYGNDSILMRSHGHPRNSKSEGGSDYLTLSNLQVSIYPNPATNSITINAGNALTFSLYDLTGRIVLDTNLSDGISNLNVSSLSKGLYLVKIQQREEVFCQKLVIQ